MDEIILKKLFLRFLKENSLLSKLDMYFNKTNSIIPLPFFAEKTEGLDTVERGIPIPKDLSDGMYFNKYIMWISTHEGYWFWKIIQMKYYIVMCMLFKENDEQSSGYGKLLEHAKEILFNQNKFSFFYDISEEEKKQIFELKKIFRKTFGF